MPKTIMLKVVFSDEQMTRISEVIMLCGKVAVEVMRNEEKSAAAEFLAERYQESVTKIEFGGVYSEFERWCGEKGLIVESKVRFGKEIAKISKKNSIMYKKMADGRITTVRGCFLRAKTA